MIKSPYIMRFTLEIMFENDPIKSAAINSNYGICVILHEYNEEKDDGYYELSSNILKAVNITNCPFYGSTLAIFKKENEIYKPFGLFMPRGVDVHSWIYGGNEGMEQLEKKISY